MAFEAFDDDDTQPSGCVLCSARSAVESAIVRIGVGRVTIVTELTRPAHGPPVERSKAFLTLANGETARGEGESREEALLQALVAAGVPL